MQVKARLVENTDFGALGKAIGEQIQATKAVPYITGIDSASLEQLKSFCASLATYGGAALFHMPGITPEADQYQAPGESLTITQADLDAANRSLSDAAEAEVDFVSLGCPHLTLAEIARIAALLEGKQVTREFWITTARPVKQMADRLGYTQIITAAGAKIAADTCCVVAPIKGRFTALAADSAKACYYAAGKNKFKTLFLPFDEVVRLATQRAAVIFRKGVTPLYLLGRKRVTLVLHTGQVPWAILRPLAASLTVPLFTLTFLRHLTQ